MEIDYESIIKNLTQRLKDVFEAQNRYFELAKKLNELKPYSEIITTKIVELPMEEQIIIMELAYQMSEVQKCLCEKHGWDDEIKSEDEVYD